MSKRYKKGYHNWHCRNCDTCTKVIHNCYYPIQVVRQYDGSLATEGDEFITSFFPIHDVFISNFDKLLSIVNHYVTPFFEIEGVNRNGGLISPSMHIHASVEVNDEVPVLVDFKILSAFYPELVALASTCGFARPLEYREYVNHTEGDHHSFVNLRMDGDPRLEWRIWEAAYYDTDYILGALYISAALSQLMLVPDHTEFLANVVYLDKMPERPRDVRHALNMFSRKRLNLLEDAVMGGTSIPTSDFAVRTVSAMFAKARDLAEPKYIVTSPASRQTARRIELEDLPTITRTAFRTAAANTGDIDWTDLGDR